MEMGGIFSKIWSYTPPLQLGSGEYHRINQYNPHKE